MKDGGLVNVDFYWVWKNRSVEVELLASSWDYLKIQTSTDALWNFYGSFLVPSVIYQLIMRYLLSYALPSKSVKISYSLE
jgi:hypothetical protein